MSSEKPVAPHTDGHPAVKQPIWEEDPQNPFNWSKKRKWLLALIASWVTFSAGINATSILTPASALAEEFGYSDAEFPTTYWTVMSWTMGAALGPMLGMPLLEEFGIRRGYLICYVFFMIFLIPQAVAQNFATLVVTRIFAGFSAGIIMNGMESVVADIFATDVERSLPITLFILVYEAGFTLGPTYGACFAESDWRWIFWVHLIVFGAFFPVLWFAMRETRGHLILAKIPPGTEMNRSDVEAAPAPDVLDTPSTQAERPPILGLFYEAIVRPLKLLVTQPVIFVLTLWSAFATALVFISTESIESVYATNFGFTERQVGIVQISIFIGEVIGFLACLPQNAFYVRSARWNKEIPGQPSPEARLVLSIPASFIGLTGGLFWYAWSSSPGISWVMPSIGLGLVGFGIVVIVNTGVAYLTDAYTSIAGSAVAAVAMGENVFSAWLPLATPRMYEVLGPHWASSLLGFVALALSFAPVALMIYGRHIRARSDLMEGKKASP